MQASGRIADTTSLWFEEGQGIGPETNEIAAEIDDGRGGGVATGRKAPKYPVKQKIRTGAEERYFAKWPQKEYKPLKETGQKKKNGDPSSKRGHLER